MVKKLQTALLKLRRKVKNRKIQISRITPFSNCSEKGVFFYKKNETLKNEQKKDEKQGLILKTNKKAP